MRSLLPIEIVGGGLAGLATGLALRRSGVPVTVHEAGVYPRHRVCGEFISGLDPGTSERLGIDAFIGDARPHRAVTYHLRGRRLRPFSMPATAWGISRYVLDARVAAAFVAAGGDLRTQDRLVDDRTPPGRVFASGRSRRGRLWVGLKVHVHNLALVNDFEVHLGDRCYIGLSRIETGAVNVCGIFNERDVKERGADILPAYLASAGLGELAERLRAADVDRSTFCVMAAPLGNRGFAPPDRIRIGDASATIPPFTGNGLAMTLQGAALAVGPLEAYCRGEAPWEATVRAIAAAQRRRFRRRLLLASVIHPFFLDPGKQALLAALVGSGLLPFRAFYAALH